MGCAAMQLERHQDTHTKPPHTHARLRSYGDKRAITEIKEAAEER